MFWKIPSNRALSAFLVAGIVLSGCGSGGETTAAEGTDEDVAAEPATPSDATTAATDESDCTKMEEALSALADLEYEERLTKIEEEAKREGTVILYASARTEQQDAWAEKFNEVYPELALQYVRVDSSTLMDRMIAEKNAGRALFDVASTDSVTGALLKAEDLYEPHQGVPVPPQIPARYVDDTFVIQYINPNVIAWNTDLVSSDEAPRDWDELLDPKWKGMVATDYAPDNWFVGLLEERGEEGAREYLDEFYGTNEALVRKGHSNLANLVAAGEVPIGAELYSYKVEELIEEGAPLDYAAPNPTPANATGISLSKCANNPFAAILLFNFFLTAEGGQVVGDLGRLHVNPEVVDIYEGHKVFTTEGTQQSEALLPIGPELASKWADAARDLVEEYSADRLQE